MPVTLPFNFVPFRIAMVQEIERVTKTKCIREETVVQGSPRPPLPYFSYKITSPGTHWGYASQQYSGTGTNFVSGTQRSARVSFHCYAADQETAYNYMCLWQMSLYSELTQENLRRAGIAVWTIEDVADLSQLLNTGWEGRAHLDAQFGIAFNMTEDLGTIEEIEVTGEVDTDKKIVEEEFTISDD